MAEQVSIKDFLKKNELATKEVKLDRFDAPFVLKELTNEETEAATRAATRHVKNPKTGQIEPQLDQQAAGVQLLLASIQVPNFNNGELQNFFGHPADPEATLKTMLKPSELSKLAEVVNGFMNAEGSLEENVDSVKN
ncbi:phage tail assembly chaperone [uncultured Secundilactobacillus sp.]|uniref:phage tail assembly chaperone n=1 Tax=uncultured Secundilactobacillus sp. TaxID=2813935 RepID=UPI002582A7C7|nr:hypothetical protein [uncultured Secundilactobacillus sp.]